MLHRIRLAMQTGSFRKMTGEVEVDETYIGARARNMHKDRKERAKGGTWYGKVAVMGLLDRHSAGHSTVRLRVIKGTKRAELIGNMQENIELGSQVFSDALPTYSSMSHLFMHQFIDHAVTYAMGKVHTNGLENFWSLLKRALKGTYVSTEPFHLFRYLDEQAFRFNTRKMTDSRASRR